MENIDNTTPDNAEFTQPKQIVPAGDHTSVSPTAELPPQNNWKWFSILIALLVLGLVGALAVNFWFKNSPSSITPPTSPEPTIVASPLPSPTSIANETSTWTTYTDETSHFNFKYPPDWERSENDSKQTLVITKDIPRSEIAIKCDQSNDCAPQAKIEITVREVSLGSTTSPCSVFGECLAADRKETIVNGTITIRMEYLREDAIYPIYSYITLPGKYIVKAKSYLPSVKNCIGNCGNQAQDSEAVQNLGQEIVNILSTSNFNEIP